MRDLTNKRALVTGAGTRVGAAIARALGAEGMHVDIHYHRNREGAEASCEAVVRAGGAATPRQADLSDPDATRELARAVLRDGDLDVLVPSAANFERVAFDAIAPSHLRHAFALNVEAPLALAIECAPALRRTHGAVVFITDAALDRPHRDYLPYLLSKAAVRQLMEVLVIELSPAVRVNAVAPGTVLPPPGMHEETIARLVEHIPLGRLGRADDVAQAVVHLASSDLANGHELVVDGGHRIGR
ncbi:MAG: SDR family oxidoreductase [Deltaproteobacteria bacterium]|nr:SDR family oxidoreductase [Deltaproteobacteria bacterium]